MNNSKIRSIYTILLLLAITFLVKCNSSVPNTNVYGEKETTQYFSFFKKGLVDKNGDKVFAEISAVTFDGTNLIFGNEDPVNINPSKKMSPIFEMPYKNFPNSNITIYDDLEFVKSRKFEDLTILSDQSETEYVVATTAFDREKDKRYKNDSYNTLLIWPTGNYKKVKMVAPFKGIDIRSSMKIRKELFKALGLTENKYYKVEGLATIPNNKLLFGIRQVGATYLVNYYTIIIISANYSIDQGVLILSNFQIAFELDIKTYINKTGYNVVGLSSLEFDKFNNRLYMLTSFEKCGTTYDDIGAYLWVLSVDKNSVISEPRLVIDKKTSKPLVFNHKAEGIAVINESELFVVHDDDEIVKYAKPKNSKPQNDRKPHQTAYTKVKIEK